MNFITLHVAKIKKLPIVWAVIVLVFLVNGYSSLNASYAQKKQYLYLVDNNENKLDDYSLDQLQDMAIIAQQNSERLAKAWKRFSAPVSSNLENSFLQSDQPAQISQNLPMQGRGAGVGAGTAVNNEPSLVSVAGQGLYNMFKHGVDVDVEHEEVDGYRLIVAAGMNAHDYAEYSNGVAPSQWLRWYDQTVMTTIKNDVQAALTYKSAGAIAKENKDKINKIVEWYTKRYYQSSSDPDQDLRKPLDMAFNDYQDLAKKQLKSINAKIKENLKLFLPIAEKAVDQLESNYVKEATQKAFDKVKPTSTEFTFISLETSLYLLDNQLQNLDIDSETTLDRKALTAAKNRLIKIKNEVQTLKSVARGDLHKALELASQQKVGSSKGVNDSAEVQKVLQKEFDEENAINTETTELEGAVEEILVQAERETSKDFAKQLNYVQEELKKLQGKLAGHRRTPKVFQEKQQEIDHYQQAVELLQEKIQAVDAKVANLLENNDDSIAAALEEWNAVSAGSRQDIHDQVLAKLDAMQAQESKDLAEVEKIVTNARSARKDDLAKQVMYVQGELKNLQGQLRTVSKAPGALKKHKDQVKYHEMAIEQLQDEIQGLRGNSKLIEERIADLIENHGGSIEAAFEEMKAIEHPDALDEKVLAKLAIMHNKEGLEIAAIHEIVNKAIEAAAQDPVLALEKIKAELKKEESALIKLKGALSKKPQEIQAKQLLVSRMQRAIDELQNKIAEHQDEEQQVEQAIQALLKKNDDDAEAALKEIGSKKGAMSDFDKKVQKQLIKQKTRTAQDEAVYAVQSKQAEDMIVAAKYSTNAMSEAEDRLTELQESLVDAQARRNAIEVNRIKKEIEEFQKVMALIPSKVKLVMKKLDEFFNDKKTQDELVAGLKRHNNKINPVALELFGQYKTFAKTKSKVRVAFNSVKLDEAIEKQIKQQVTQFVEDQKEAKKSDPVEKALANLKAGDVSVSNLDTVIEGQLAQMGIKVEALNNETREQLAAIVSDTAVRLTDVMNSSRLQPAQKQMQKQIIMKGMLKETAYLLAAYRTGASQAALATGNLSTIATDIALQKFINYLTPSQE